AEADRERGRRQVQEGGALGARPGAGHAQGLEADREGARPPRDGRDGDGRRPRPRADRRLRLGARALSRVAPVAPHPRLPRAGVDSARPMRVLLIGSGGREHALAWGLARSPSLGDLHAAPGNPGIARIATCSDVPVGDLAELTELAVSIEADLVVVGPEAPLVAGLADRLADAGVLCFGPLA